MESQGVSEKDLITESGSTARSTVERLRDAYLSLMEKCLTGTIYEDKAFQAVGQEADLGRFAAAFAAFK